MEILNLIFFLISTIIGYLTGHSFFKKGGILGENWFNWSKKSLLLTILISLAITVFLAYIATISDNNSTFFGNLFNSLMGTGAFVAAVFAALVIGEMVVQRNKMDDQLEEMKNQTLEMQTQRKLQYSPELIAENDFNIYFHNCDEFLKDFPEVKKYEFGKELGVWSASSEVPRPYCDMISNAICGHVNETALIDTLKNLVIYHDKNLGLKLYNVGNGVAKKIQYTWEYDFDKLFSFLEGQNQKDSSVSKKDIDMELPSEKTFEKATQYFFGTQTAIIFNSSALKKYEWLNDRGNHNLVLPHRSPEDFLVIPLPTDVLKIIGYFSKTRGISLMIGSLVLNIEYWGIDETKHIKTYEISNLHSIPLNYSGIRNKKYEYREFRFNVSEVESKPGVDKKSNFKIK